MTTSTSNLGSKVGRSRRRLSQLWQVPTFLIGLLAFLGVAASTPWRLTPQEKEFDRLVNALRAGLDNNEPADVLVGHAEAIQLRMQVTNRRAAEAHFLVGSAYFRQALQKPAVEAWEIVAQHLEEALAHGGASEDKAALQYRLGYSLYQLYRDVPRALELVTLGVEKGAEQPLQGYQLLVDAYLKRTPPNVDGALSASGRVLDLTPDRDIEAVAQARLQHGELLMRKELRAEAIKVLERIGPKAPRGVWVKARMLQARCCEDDGFWNKAIPIWQELLAEAAQVEGGRARVLYALGWCNQNLEPANNSETIRIWSEALKSGGAAGQAAGLQLGKLRLRLGGKNALLALADWNTALTTVHTPQDFRNPYIEQKTVVEWFEKAIRDSHEAREPEKTQILAELYRKIAPAGIAELRIGAAAEDFANLLRAKHHEAIDHVTLDEVHAQYRRAGEAFECAAKMRPDAERTEMLWRSAQCYLSAKDAKRAQAVLQEYVKREVREPRLAEAWYDRADLYRLDGNVPFAHDAFIKCLQYPKTPFAFRSRYFLAVEEENQNHLDKALLILEDNFRDTFDIDRHWQEMSLFKKASLLIKVKNYDEAHIHLKDFLHLFPDSRQALMAREHLGQCYRHMAEKERQKEKELEQSVKPNMPDNNLQERIGQQRKTRLNLLTSAVRTYQELVDELEKTRLRAKQLSSYEQTMLRRARLGIGECQLDNEEYNDALYTFHTLQMDNRRTLDGFYACQFFCYVMQKLPEPQKTKERVEQAKKSIRLLIEDVKSLPPDHEIFRTPGVTPRDGWLRWAEEAQQKLAVPPRNDKGLPAIR